MSLKVSIKRLILIGIIFFAVFLRFYNLNTNPPGLYVDEVSLGYNAYSILKTARDEYGNFMPMVFRSFNTFNPPFAVYTLVPSIAVLGLNEFGVRFPSAMAGSMTVLLTFFLVKKISKDDFTALFSTFLLAISPWHLHFSRFYHEANLMVSFSILGLVIFLYSKNFLFKLVLASVCFGIALNTAHMAKLYVPLFLIVSALNFKRDLIQFGKKLVLPLAILAIFSIPQALNYQESLARPFSVSIFKEKGSKFDNIINAYLSHFSPSFLFNRGDYQGRHSVPGMGELYVFEFPLLILGLFFLIKSKNRMSNFLLSWLLIAPIPASLSSPTPHAGRALTLMPLLPIICAFGFKIFLNLKIATSIKIITLAIILPIALYNVITYFHLYWKHYPKEKAPDWSDGHKSMVNYIAQVYDRYDSIYITKWYGHPYIYVLFYLKYDPAKYHPQSQNKDEFDKFKFFSQFPQNLERNSLIISTPPQSNYIEEFNMNNGDTVFVATEFK